jgi:hypothetical protein
MAREARSEAAQRAEQARPSGVPQAQPSGSHPLDGVVVLDLGQIYNAPYTTFLSRRREPT